MNPILYAVDPETTAQPGGAEGTTSAPDLTTLETNLRRLKASGFDGVELFVTPGFMSRFGSELSASIGRVGLPALALSTPWRFPESSSDWQASDAGFHHIDQFVPGIGAKLLTLRLFRPANLALDEARKSLTGALIEAANHFDPRGVTVAVEFCDGGVLGPYSEAMDWLYFHAPQAGLAVNTASLAAGGEDPYRAITELGPLVKLVYLDATAGATLDHSRLFSALKSTNCPAPIVLRGAIDDSGIANALSSLRQAFADAPVQAVAVTES